MDLPGPALAAARAKSASGDEAELRELLERRRSEVQAEIDAMKA